jgi:hypothetical protein
MKIQVTISVVLFTLILMSKVTLTQITITSTDAFAINTVGNVITNHFDSITTSIDIGSPGATSWDFSGLNCPFTSAYTNVLPSLTPYYLSDFPISNVAFYFDINISPPGSQLQIIYFTNQGV